MHLLTILVNFFDHMKNAGEDPPAFLLKLSQMGTVLGTAHG